MNPGIKNNVYFLGMRSDISAILKLIDLYVVSSKSEGVSLSIPEAMASGIPVITTNVGGNQEVIIKGQCGFLVPPGQPEIMAHEILKALSNEHLSN